MKVRYVHHLYKYDTYCLHDEVDPEHVIVFSANAYSNEAAVMVITVNTPIARRAMLGAHWLINVTHVTVSRRWVISISAI
jgi:hypothetical protein